MKKLILVISDLHIGKGRYLPDGSMNISEDFFSDEKLIEFLQYYRKGEHEKVEVELILNGDIFNFFQIDYKGKHPTIITEDISLTKLQSAIDGHPSVFDELQNFVNTPFKSIVYIIGNHDIDMLWKQCQDYFSKRLATRVKFKNILYYIDGFHIEHGHQYEVNNRINPKRFFIRPRNGTPFLNLPWGALFCITVLTKIKTERSYVDKVKPFSSFIKWSLFNDTFFAIKTIFRIVGYFFQTWFSKTKYQFSNITTSIHTLRKISIFSTLSNFARKVLSSEDIHTVIFGHTHNYRYQKFSGNKVYINCGTWTEVTSLELNTFGKILRHTYVIIEYPDDGTSPRATLKEWKGSWKIQEDIAV